MRSKIYLFKEVKRDRLSFLAARNANRKISRIGVGNRLQTVGNRGRRRRDVSGL